MGYGEAAAYACWAALAAVWLVGAAAGPSGARNDGSRAPDTASRAAAFAAVLILLSPRTWWAPFTVHSAAATVTGIVILVPATAFTLWARVRLGAMWSSAPVTRAGHELRTDGPYRVTRHPVYTGIIAMLVGTAVAQGLGRWFVLVAVVAVAVVAKALAEERLLIREFPVAYGEYRKSVPRLVPRLRSRGR